MYSLRIKDRRISITVVAPEGRLISEPEKFTYHLILSNGTIHQTNPKERSANSIQFNTYTLSLNFKEQFAEAAKRKKGREEMGVAELRQYIDELAGKDEEAFLKSKMELHRRYSLPTACLALGLLAFPLGIQSKTARRSFGLILGLFFFFAYYLLLTAGYSFGKSGVLSPEIGMWLPNFVMTGIGLFFLLKTAKDRSLKIDLLAQRFQLILSKFYRAKRTH
jgi:lipopolysaccharide export system permease protein